MKDSLIEEQRAAMTEIREESAARQVQIEEQLRELRKDHKLWSTESVLVLLLIMLLAMNLSVQAIPSLKAFGTGLLERFIEGDCF